MKTPSKNFLNSCCSSSCLIFDFDDSFTFNIAAELYRLGLHCQVIPLPLIPLVLRKLQGPLSHRCRVLIYGPGPGGPDDYGHLFPLITPLLTPPFWPSFYHLGICLGHQLLLRLQGYRVIPSRRPVHGGTEEITLPFWPDVFPLEYLERSGREVSVQRYNSLVVDIPKKRCEMSERFFFHRGELMASRWPWGVTYQFHPESVGTSYPSLFFSPVTQFLSI